MSLRRSSSPRADRLRLAAPVALFLALLAAPPLSAAQTLPTTPAETLSGARVTLPGTFKGRYSVLVVGFSKKSGDVAGAWAKKLNQDFAAQSNLAIYQIAVIEDAPSFVRGFITRGMRKGTPVDQRPRFIPVTENESAWKQAVGYSAPDDAYLLILDPRADIVWHTHGVFSENSYRELRAHILSALHG